MFNACLTLALLAVAWAGGIHVLPSACPLKFPRVPTAAGDELFLLCSDTQIEYRKCVHTVVSAQNLKLPLSLGCVKEDLGKCLESVQQGYSDMVVVHGYGYSAARKAGLKPVIFAREGNASLYVAMGQHGLSLDEVRDAPLQLDHTKDRAYHAAIFFNMKRGHDVCHLHHHVDDMDVHIKILDIAQYKPSAGDFLICPDYTFANISEYRKCNIEAGLERAVFVANDTSSYKSNSMARVFDSILMNFNGNTNFEFFKEFHGQPDVIFKDDTIDFEMKPFYRNNVTEQVYKELHCNHTEGSHHHDPSQLE